MCGFPNKDVPWTLEAAIGSTSIEGSPIFAEMVKEHCVNTFQSRCGLIYVDLLLCWWKLFLRLLSSMLRISHELDWTRLAATTYIHVTSSNKQATKPTTPATLANLIPAIAMASFVTVINQPTSRAKGFGHDQTFPGAQPQREGVFPAPILARENCTVHWASKGLVAAACHLCWRKLCSFKCSVKFLSLLMSTFVSLQFLWSRCSVIWWKYLKRPSQRLSKAGAGVLSSLTVAPFLGSPRMARSETAIYANGRAVDKPRISVHGKWM